MPSLFKNTDFKSFVDTRHKNALEQLVYFNPCQYRVQRSIVDAVESFGSPEIAARAEHLVVELPKFPEAQTLFAAEQGSGRPLGLVVFLRLNHQSFTVLHVSIAPEFAHGGIRAQEQLLLRLLRQLRSGIRSIKGVKHLDLYYQLERKQARRHVPVLAEVSGL